MTARVPYLSALTRQASASQPTLRPPRLLFAGLAPPMPMDSASLPSELGAHPAARGMPPAPSTTPQPPPMTQHPLTLDPAQPHEATPGQSAHDQPLIPDTALIPAGPLDFWADPSWALPVELPSTPMRKDISGAVHLPEPSRPGQQPADDRRGPVPDLMPSPASAAVAADRPGLTAGPARHRPRDSGPAKLSIGTIEVTVVPPAPPAAPPRPVRRDRPRPVSPTPPAPSSPPADRLRDGIRRWHGTAQG